MDEQIEARIVITHRKDGRASISLWSPSGRRHVETGLVAGPGPDEIAREVGKVRNMLERKGMRVTFAER